MSPEKLSPLEFAKKAAEDSEAVLAGWNKEISDEEIVGKDEEDQKKNNVPEESGEEKNRKILQAEIDNLEKEIAELEQQQLEISKIDDEEGVEEIAENISRKKEALSEKKQELENLEMSGTEMFERAQGLEASAKARIAEQEVLERAENISRQEKEVEEARKDYVETDYKKNKAYKRVYKFLGSVFKGREEKELENDKDIAHYREIYDKKLFDYKNLLLDDAKNRKVSNRELGEIVKIFDVEASVNLKDVHMQVKIEHHEGKFSERIKQNSMEIVQRYKKMPLKAKIGIAVAFGLVGWQASALGAAAVGIAISASRIRNIFMGMVTGTSLAMALESRDVRKGEEKIEKETADFVKNLENLSEEERFKRAFEEINNLNFSSDKKLQKFKNKNVVHLSAGVFVGTIVGSGVISEAFKWAGNKTGVSQWVMEKLGLETSPEAMPGGKGGGGAMDKIAETESPAGGELSVGDTAENFGKNIELPEFEKGGIEASIRDHFRANPDLVEKYNQLHSGGRNFSPGEIAHRMFEEYGDQRDLVHPGGRVILSPDGMSIKEMADENLDYLPGEEPNLPNELPEGAPNELPPSAQNPEVEVVPENNGSWADSRAKVEYVDEIKTNPDSFFGKNSASILQDLDGQIAQNTEELSRSYMHSNEGLEAIRERITDLGYSRGFLEKFSGSVLDGNQNEAVKSFRSAIALNENWESVKNMNFREAADKMNWRAGDKLKTIFKYMEETIGSEMKPGASETLEKWTERAAKLAIEKTK